MKLHARDEYDRRQLERAVYFTATLFLGREHGFHIERVATLEGARKLAVRLPAIFPGCNRRPMIYAITPEGYSIHVG